MADSPRLIIPRLLLGFLICASCLNLSKPACCEYNLATGEEEDLFISTEKEIKMGENLSKRVEKKFKLDESYTNQEKVDIIGQRLAAVSDRRDIIYHFKVVDDDKDNAFALPGGYVYIFKGLLEKLETDDEIAAILAHEIGHVCARHHIKRLQNSFSNTILRILMIKGAKDAYTARKASEAISHLMLAHNRKDEIEADRLAVKYLGKAGYDKKAALGVLDKLIKWQMEGPIKTKRYWYTHPYLSARKAAVSKEINGEIGFDDYINTASDEDYVNTR